MSTFEEFRQEVCLAIKNRPVDFRPGQAAFNYIVKNYEPCGDLVGSNVDCFYRDELISDFIDAAWNKINS